MGGVALGSGASGGWMVGSTTLGSLVDFEVDADTFGDKGV